MEKPIIIVIDADLSVSKVVSLVVLGLTLFVVYMFCVPEGSCEFPL